MRKVKLKVCRAGNDFVQKIGDVVDMADDEAARMVSAEMAEYVDGGNRKPDPEPEPQTNHGGEPPAPPEDHKPRRGRKSKTAE